jgi:lysozyme
MSIAPNDPKVLEKLKEKMEHRINRDGISLIQSFEGFREKPYLDSVGVATIGYGSTYYEDGRPVTLHDAPVTKERAEALFLHVLKSFEDAVSKLVTTTINSNQFSALVSFAYNLGSGNLAKSTLLKFVNNREFDKAAGEFVKWSSAGGKQMAGLLRRREAEKALFLKRTV